jgi:phenylalanyl-tRNA synthetase beta chain
MIISVNWLKKFTDIDLPIDQLATLIGARLVEIEEVIDYGARYKDILIAKVVECTKLKDSDHLNIAKIDDGGQAKDIKRDDDGLVQVICGAPNIRAGLLVAWLPPGSVVPETYSTKPYILEIREVCGVKSNGMIASAKELNLSSDHTGILEIDKETKPGDSFAKIYELDDHLLDIENKSLTHRPDCFGLIGFAREVAAIQGKQFTTPDWLTKLAPQIITKNVTKSLNVSIDNPELSARYQAIVLSDVSLESKTPLEIQTYLARVGVRPISPIVDITNYLMLLTGQPLHAFDYDKFIAINGGQAEIHVRTARSGESLELLDRRTIKLDEEDIVITAGNTPVALAGAMGGAATEIDDQTKNIIIESATFNLYNLRSTQMRHGIFSEAITRFTKGQPVPLTAPVLAEAIRLFSQYTGTQVDSLVAEACSLSEQPNNVKMSKNYINEVLGTNIPVDNLKQTLTNAEFKVEVDDINLLVTPPYWRTDISIQADVIEEIGRLQGFDNITPTLPKRNLLAIMPCQFDELRNYLRRLLVQAGSNEILTYSFVHGDVMKKAGQIVDQAYRISNSLSPDLQYYRQSLIPSLLTLIYLNLKAGFDEFALFEFNKIHSKQFGLTAENVPVELDSLGFVMTSKRTDRAAYYSAKSYLEFMANNLGCQFAYKPLDKLSSEPKLPLEAPFEPRRSARIYDKTSDKILGVVGEFKPSVQRALKLPQYTAGFEIDPSIFLNPEGYKLLNYSPLSKYPGTSRDVCFQTSADLSYSQLVEAIYEVLQKVDLSITIKPIDIYRGESSITKNLTIRFDLVSSQQTLTNETVNQTISDITSKVCDNIKARVI